MTYKIVKRSLLAVALCLFTLTGYSQTNTPVAINTNAPIFSSVLFTGTTSSNWYLATGMIYDQTSKQYGAWLAAGYKLSDFIVPFVRIDEIGNRVVVPSGTLQLQAPITLFGKYTVVPLTFAAVATSLNNFISQNNGEVIGIFGAGVALRINSTKWYVPRDILFDYERWTGGGFNDTQFRGGLAFQPF